jgi:hypothetical protein
MSTLELVARWVAWLAIISWGTWCAYQRGKALAALDEANATLQKLQSDKKQTELACESAIERMRTARKFAIGHTLPIARWYYVVAQSCYDVDSYQHYLKECTDKLDQVLSAWDPIEQTLTWTFLAGSTHKALTLAAELDDDEELGVSVRWESGAVQLSVTFLGEGDEADGSAGPTDVATNLVWSAALGDLTKGARILVMGAGGELRACTTPEQLEQAQLRGWKLVRDTEATKTMQILGFVSGYGDKP